MTLSANNIKYLSIYMIFMIKYNFTPSNIFCLKFDLYLFLDTLFRHLLLPKFSVYRMIPYKLPSGLRHLVNATDNRCSSELRYDVFKIQFQQTRNDFVSKTPSIHFSNIHKSFVPVTQQRN